MADRGPTGKLTTVNLEDETTEKFGANELTDLRWKDIFDADACTLCKRCQDRCPAYTTGKPLSPMKLVNQIGEIAFTDPGGQSHRYHRPGRHLGLHHLPGLPGHLPGLDRTCQ